ncbi:MAG: GNAT family N-acetyltransferase, partial [Microcoleus sp. SIO2G3]|nr:GNAT family N-acetyltransferase [Microcoleus sp. SIO2G3]
MDCRSIQFYVHDREAIATLGASASPHENRKSRIDYHQLQELFRLGAFWAKDRKIEDWKIAIANSEPVITVWDGDRLIGFSRATSDGIYRATIWDVVIHPDYRGAGLVKNSNTTSLNGMPLKADLEAMLGIPVQ